MAHATHVTDYDAYFAYLLRRKQASVWWKNAWLYPRIFRHLPGAILDVGCGIGDLLKFRPTTVGVDVNPRAVEYCRRQGLNAHFMQPDRLPFATQCFDGAVLDNVLEHIEQPGPLLTEIHRVVKPGGSVVVGVPGKRGYASDPDHKRHYPEGALKETLECAGFASMSVFYQPFRSKWLDEHLYIYAIYGAFRRCA